MNPIKSKLEMTLNAWLGREREARGRASRRERASTVGASQGTGVTSADSIEYPLSQTIAIALRQSRYHMYHTLICSHKECIS